jgi:glycyl-tRNA synthetase (class II)
MTYSEDVDGLDASILMHPTVWKASGHIDNFSDPLVDCKQCKLVFVLIKLISMRLVKTVGQKILLLNLVNLI